MFVDKAGMIILLGLVMLLLTFALKRNLLEKWGWVKVFGVGGSIYVIISSLFYSITGKPFWNDPLLFYRLVIAIGAMVYVGVILDFYGIKFKKKKITQAATLPQPKPQKQTNKKKVKRKK